MAANEETVSIDTVKKTLWDSLEALGENISGETLTALMEIIEGGGGSSDSLFVIYALGELDGTTITLSNINKTPAELAAAVAAKKPAFLRLNLHVEDEVYFVYVPLTQVAGSVYQFVGIMSIETEAINVAEISLIDNDGTWGAAGRYIVITSA